MREESFEVEGLAELAAHLRERDVLGYVALVERHGRSGEERLGRLPEAGGG